MSTLDAIEKTIEVADLVERFRPQLDRTATVAIVGDAIDVGGPVFKVLSDGSELVGSAFARLAEKEMGFVRQLERDIMSFGQAEKEMGFFRQAQKDLGLFSKELPVADLALKGVPNF